MDSFEINKIAGAILFSMLVMFGIANLAGVIVSPKPLKEAAYKVEVPEEPSGPAEPAGGGAEPPVAVALASANPEAGQAAAKKCAACHSFEKGGANKVGPNLYDIVGNKKGHAEGFAYSEAITGKGGEWSYDELYAFLKDPKAYAPGTKMAFAGIKSPKERADLLAWLRTQSDNPKPLPEAPPQQQSGNGAAAAPTQAAASAAPAAKPIGAMLAAADPEKGKNAAKVCGACHSFEKGGPNKIGPGLWGVIGMKKAGHDGFSYSNALGEKGGTWTYEDMAAWLENPKAFAPGNKMAFPGVKKPEDRADIIAWLRTLSDDPQPLPAQ